ncbi:hypothetical protein EPI10_023776 [Gossypium australe]|uniref:Uncharacterized protein n=1 Tax=Gossypium australe TaxID=47621 RepID=A0A5B6VWT9_9ROSI|nr:hypothetical protein EPI10_023776 [Gossypium australe]
MEGSSESGTKTGVNGNIISSSDNSLASNTLFSSAPKVSAIEEMESPQVPEQEQLTGTTTIDLGVIEETSAERLFRDEIWVA